MIDSVKADNGESECNLEMDPDERESNKRFNTIISTIEKRFSVKVVLFTAILSVQNYIVGSLMIYRQPFDSTQFISSITTYFIITLFITLTTPAKKKKTAIS